MSNLSIFDTAWTDMVFEGRNKDYGAYQLRKENPRTTIMALLCAFALMGVAVAIPGILSYFAAPQVIADVPVLVPATILEYVKPPEKIEPPKPVNEVSPPAAPPATAVPSASLANAHVTENPVDAAEPTMNTAPVVENPTGPTGPATTALPGPTARNTEPEEPTGPINMESADVKPEFPGGMEKFYKYVGRNFQVPENDAVAGRTLKVIVYFVVEKDGSMTDIKVLRNPGYDLDKEAIRVLKSMNTKWKPGKYKGKEVRIAYTLPITVQAPQ